MRFPSPGSAQGYYSYNFLNLMSYSEFIFRCISLTQAIGLLFYYLLFLSSNIPYYYINLQCFGGGIY